MIPGGRALLVVTALAEELRTVLEAQSICEQKAGRPSATDPHAVEGRIRFLKTGVGPGRAAGSLRRALVGARPLRVLIAGYAGALDPGLRLGDIVLARRAILLSRDGNALETWELGTPHPLLEMASAAGLRAYWGDLATSGLPVEDAGQKSQLFASLGASAVDMETAALARVAGGFGVPVSCVRVITDEAAETFPTPKCETCLSSWWEARTTVARKNLSRFCAAFFEAGGPSLLP